MDNAECKGIENWEGGNNRNEFIDPLKNTFYHEHAGVDAPSSVDIRKSMK